jgi:hypothetical protein
MNENTSTAIWGSIAALALMVAIVAIAYFTSQNIINGAKQDTLQITACVEHGGTWLNQYKNCIGGTE